MRISSSRLRSTNRIFSSRRDCLITALGKHELGVSLMSWPLGYHHGFSAHPAERFGRGEDQQRVRIDCIARKVIDQVGLEDHRLAADVDREESKTGGEDLVQLLGVLLDMENRNSGSLRPLIRMIFGQKKRSRDGSASSHRGAPDKELSTSKAHKVTPKADKARL